MSDHGFAGQSLPRPWAKLARDCRDGHGGFCRKACACPVTRSLSLIGHSADVAAVMQVLLEQPVIARRLARLLGAGGLSEEDVAQLSALTALHDLGKINLGFQRKPFAVPGAKAGHIAPLVSLLGGDLASGRIMQRLLNEGGLARFGHLLCTKSGDPTPFCAALAHHGSLPDAGSGAAELWQSERAYDPIAACKDLIDAIATWFPAAVAPTPIAWTHPFEHAFAGLLTLADWLGSDTRYFPYDGNGAPAGIERYRWSREHAQEIVARRRISPQTQRQVIATLPWTFAALTGLQDPSPAQAAMLALPPAPDGGRICLIEDETGSGKTEAALIHFIDLFGKGVVDGMYFALPTRAAARQIHGRIEKSLRRLFGDRDVHVTLAVPGYIGHLATDADLPTSEPLWPDASGEARRDEVWAGERPKRYLASWVAVGTIDQVLMGGLRVRHAQLRSGAMLRLLLVVDEVHASDIYMTAILRNVLDQHIRAGGHALLMSATLGSSARAKLLQPTGRVAQTPAYATAVEALYPAIWATPSAEPLATHLSSEAETSKDVTIDIMNDWRDPTSIAARAVEAARAGARVLVIRNTVRDVVATQLALETIAPEFSLSVTGNGVGTIRSPHHARYAAEDRTVLDAALEAGFGKSALRGTGLVAVASQTAEQSLDIDADLVITDLCPADVLLQRVGRLHRHRRFGRQRPTGFRDPVVVIIAPTEHELAAAILENGEVRNPPLALGLVYPNLLGVAATRRALAAAGVIRIPRDNRQLVETATHPAYLADLASELGGAWLTRWGSQEGVKGAQAQAAENSRLKWDCPIAPIGIDEKIVARLGLNDRSVELQLPVCGPFGVPISRLSIPGRWLAANLPIDAPATVGRDSRGVISITVGDRRFMYDRLGLRPGDGPTA